MNKTDASVEPLSRPQPQPDLTVRCKDCGHDITPARAAIEVGGAHEHTFRNPGGYSFHLLCFGLAPGCLAAGIPTAQASWFAGYDWSFALCSACHTHLGWWYRGGAHTFVGLIATRVLRPIA